MDYLSIPLFTDSFTEDTHCHLSFTYMKLETLATFVCCGALLNYCKVGLKKYEIGNPRHFCLLWSIAQLFQGRLRTY